MNNHKKYKICCFIFIVINTFTALSLADDTFSDIIYSIDPNKYNIEIKDDHYLIGPYCYTVLKGSVAFSNKKEIIIINNTGEVTHRIKLSGLIVNFDLDDNGDGFVAIHDDNLYVILYAIEKYKIQKDPVNPGLPLSRSNIRIDIIKDKVRFIRSSPPPRFIAFSNLKTPYNTTFEHYEKSNSILHTNEGTFIGEYKNTFIFLDWDIATSNDYFHFISVISTDGQTKTCKKFDFSSEDYGLFFQESFIYKLDSDEDFFYMMVYKDNKINIIRFDIDKLMKYSIPTSCDNITTRTGDREIPFFE